MFGSGGGAAGNSTVYVPMMGTSSPQGVIEIYGLFCPSGDDSATTTASGSNQGKTYQRSSNALKAMLQAKDYK